MTGHFPLVKDTFLQKGHKSSGTGPFTKSNFAHLISTQQTEKHEIVHLPLPLLKSGNEKVNYIYIFLCTFQPSN